MDTIRGNSSLDKQGMSLLDISDAAEAINLRSRVALVNFQALKEDVQSPAIIHWKENHFVIIYKINSRDEVYIADPAFGLIKISKSDFLRNWSGKIVDGEKEGVILFFEPMPGFFEQADSEDDDKWLQSFGRLRHYMVPHKSLIFQLFLSLFASSLLLFAFPFLTQSIVDVGITNQDMGFIRLVLMAQLMLFVGQIVGGVIRNWILLQVGLRINISMVSDFLVKLTRLPIAYFDTRGAGDFLQRIMDHDRVEEFLTRHVTNTLFSLFNITVFLIVLLWFDLTIFSIFIIGTLLYILWIAIFLQKRRVIDYRKFDLAAQNQDQLINLLNGMQEIKMNNAEKVKRWQWENIQSQLFKVNVKGLYIDQYQQLGSSFINEAKNILITFFAASGVISGNLTLGEMLAVQYIIGQLNAPVMELIFFIRSLQDAKISLERVDDVRQNDDEEPNNIQKTEELPEVHDLQFDQLNFRYGSNRTPLVLKSISATIEGGKTTAIIGGSGSGKTTLMKLLLKFYEPTSGEIKLGNKNLSDYGYSFWRNRCAVVMQDGFIFPTTITENICIHVNDIDKQRLIYAAKTANMHEFIRSLPQGYNTIIGPQGTKLSGGQYQRILIARAVYKNPEFLFFDEATSSLDAKNEQEIMDNLNRFFQNKTVVIIAHRLSTVKNAHKILVLENGEIIEEGNHKNLINKKGAYFHLVKNQLELGN